MISIAQDTLRWRLHSHNFCLIYCNRFILPWAANLEVNFYHGYLSTCWLSTIPNFSHPLKVLEHTPKVREITAEGNKVDKPLFLSVAQNKTELRYRLHLFCLAASDQWVTLGDCTWKQFPFWLWQDLASPATQIQRCTAHGSGWVMSAEQKVCGSRWRGEDTYYSMTRMMSCLDSKAS